MATQTITFAYSINDKVTHKTTGRAAWVEGLFMSRDNIKQYNLTTTLASGQPTQVWATEADIEPFV